MFNTVVSYKKSGNPEKKLSHKTLDIREKRTICSQGNKENLEKTHSECS